MYKTKWGIKAMDRIANTFPGLLRVLGIISVITGFLGMGAIFTILFHGTYKLLTSPNAQPVVAPILPGVSIPGVPMLSFWHWILGILIVAAVHEFMHGIYSRLHNIKVKSSGFAFLGPILAAFVEPDEQQLKKASKYKQLSVISAGPFANFLLAGAFLLLILFILTPFTHYAVEAKGVQITSIDPAFPISNTPLTAGMSIDKINNQVIKNTEDFIKALEITKPGQTIFVTSDAQTIPVQLGAATDNPEKPRLGVSISPKEVNFKKESLKPFYPVYTWFAQLCFWIFTISLGVGLFNLLPLGPVDGGRMFMIASLWFTKNDETKAKKIWMTVTFLCLLLIAINLAPYLFKLLKFIFQPVLALLIFLF